CSRRLPFSPAVIISPGILFISDLAPFAGALRAPANGARSEIKRITGEMMTDWLKGNRLEQNKTPDCPNRG
ncbi:MAG TPA: hypothetical protein V6C78_10165, partial [Crinalium sp.]